MCKYLNMYVPNWFLIQFPFASKYSFWRKEKFVFDLLYLMIDKGSLMTSFLIISDPLIIFLHHINAIDMIHKKNNVKYMCMLIKFLHEAQ